jgi:CO/xanthine dehydrogenase Mo-binding subunit
VSLDTKDPEAPLVAPGSAVGASVPRADGRAKVSGRAEFVGDLAVPRMLHGKVLRSEFAHALVRKVDASGAEGLDGVVAVLTGADLGDLDPYYGHAIRDRPVVALDRVRFSGEPVAAVAAETEAIAEAAVSRIVVEYEELPAVVGVRAALASGAPLLHEGPQRSGFAHGLGDLGAREGNVCYRHAIDLGDVDKAFRTADVVVEGTYTFPAVYQYALETHTVIASYDPDEITVWSSCQHPFLVRQELAELFGFPTDRVRVIVPFVGGGFGSKSYTKIEPITVALARKAGRPVRIVNSVAEAMLTTRRHNMECRMRTAARRDGTVLARDVELWLDTGAYADNGPRVTATAADAAPGPYRWAAVRVRAHCVYTNTSPAGSYRAFGAVHLQWIGESQIDEVARRCGVDRLNLRRRNLLLPGQQVRPGGKPLDADLVGDVERVAEAIGWGGATKPWQGRGISVGLLAAGAHPVSMATVRLDAAGKVEVLVGTTEVGQGARTVMAQIAAEVLALRPEDVVVRPADTRYTPYDRSTGASRSTTVAGRAVELAARDVLDSLVETACEALGVAPSALTVEGGAIRRGERTLTYPELVHRRFGFQGGEVLGHGEVRPARGTGSYAEGPVFWEVCVAGAEVEVDPDTGVISVLRTASVADVGRAINPRLIERQDEGATLQGLGNALFEEMDFSPDGALVNNTLLEYRIPSLHDAPGEMHCVIVENGDGPGPFGAKGCGEGVQAAIPAAVVNAVADAGVPMRELPMTPARVWRRIQEMQSSRAEA